MAMDQSTGDQLQVTIMDDEIRVTSAAVTSAAVTIRVRFIAQPTLRSSLPSFVTLLQVKCYDDVRFFGMRGAAMSIPAFARCCFTAMVVGWMAMQGGQAQT